MIAYLAGNQTGKHLTTPQPTASSTARKRILRLSLTLTWTLIIGCVTDSLCGLISSLHVHLRRRGSHLTSRLWIKLPVTDQKRSRMWYLVISCDIFFSFSFCFFSLATSCMLFDNIRNRRATLVAWVSKYPPPCLPCMKSLLKFQTFKR